MSGQNYSRNIPIAKWTFTMVGKICVYDSFVSKQIFVFKTNICGGKLHLCKYLKRYQQTMADVQILTF